MSYTSRSMKFAAFHAPVMLGTASSSSTSTRRNRRSPWPIE
jgi:hypothetical protein